MGLKNGSVILIEKKKMKILFGGRTLLMILMVKKLLEFFTKKNCKTSNLEVLKEKGDELYVKLKVYGDSLDS